MSQKLINRSPDLQQLQNLGYDISVVGGVFLVVKDIPYVTSEGIVEYGSLVSKLNLAGDKTGPVEDHVAYFIGTQPHNADGSVITGIINPSGAVQLHEHLHVNLTFSAKPTGNMYPDYYEKVLAYVTVISSQAQLINPNSTARHYRPVVAQDDPESVFNYYDTNSSRAEISPLSVKFENQKVAIIGLGGTGSYILDQVAKTPVAEIHLFDQDDFLQHNAFRAPGAPTIQELEEMPKKVNYLAAIYSKMHKYIIPHDFNITQENLEHLNEINFVFLSIDKGGIKKSIINYLAEKSIPFVDVGLGVETVNEKLRGSLRTTSFSGGDSQYFSTWIPFSDEGNDEYAQNIQVADLNSLNAALAVIKWKKMLNFYHDLEMEKNCSYDIDVNTIFNNETNT